MSSPVRRLRGSFSSRSTPGPVNGRAARQSSCPPAVRSFSPPTETSPQSVHCAQPSGWGRIPCSPAAATSNRGTTRRCRPKGGLLWITGSPHGTWGPGCSPPRHSLLPRPRARPLPRGKRFRGGRRGSCSESGGTETDATPTARRQTGAMVPVHAACRGMASVCFIHPVWRLFHEHAHPLGGAGRRPVLWSGWQCREHRLPRVCLLWVL